MPKRPMRLLVAPGYNETRRLTQKIGSFIKQIKMLDGLIGQHAGLIAGALDAQNRDKRRLARRRVLAGRLANRAGIALGVEKIVGDLVSEAEIVRKGMKRVNGIRRGTAEHGPRFAGKGDQRAGLQLLQTGDANEGQGAVLRFRLAMIERLAAAPSPARPPHAARRLSKFRSGRGPALWHAPSGWAADDLEGERLQRVAGRGRRSPRPIRGYARWAGPGA